MCFYNRMGIDRLDKLSPTWKALPSPGPEPRRHTGERDAYTPFRVVTAVVYVLGSSRAEAFRTAN